MEQPGNDDDDGRRETGDGGPGGDSDEHGRTMPMMMMTPMTMTTPAFATGTRVTTRPAVSTSGGRRTRRGAATPTRAFFNFGGGKASGGAVDTTPYICACAPMRCDAMTMGDDDARGRGLTLGI